jgi:CRISPR-associated protein Cmr1
MPKEIPDCPQKPKPAFDAGRGYEIELITPMFGGGAEPRWHDPAFPIRPTAIRGQLQFWWRATVAARYPSLAQLRAAQMEVWGSTARASPVQLAVDHVRTSEPTPCAKIEWDPRARRGKGASRTRWQPPFDERDALPYVLFPFQGQPPADFPEQPNGNIEKSADFPEQPNGDIEKSAGGEPADLKTGEPEQMPDNCLQSARFCLRLRCPESIWPEIERAVWAWVNFGGLGARTRRGCGAIYCQDLAPPSVEGLAEWFKRFVPASTPTRRWSTISHPPLVRNEPQDPLTVWNRLIKLYRFFRQGEGFARNPGARDRDPGRSLYPEAETIRRITRRRMPKHEPWKGMPDGFPRAELGLPIVFQFKGADQGEPAATTLYPFVEGKAAERMASPLILKPLALSRDSALPMIVCLNTAGILTVELQDENKRCLTPRHAVPVRSAAFDAKGSPLCGLSPVGSAVEAFLAFARAADFTEQPNGDMEKSAGFAEPSP